nr:hypothetical protein [Tanacetum cinerariifolium]
MQTQTSNTLHNAIMEAGSKDRQPMLAPVQINVRGIDNDIYSTVDACPNACEMWKAIERLKQGELINVQDLESNLYWELKNSHLKMSQELKTVSYHKLYDILKQHQHEVNEFRAEKIARVANPLALVAQQQPVYHPQNHPTHYTQNSSTRSQQAANRNRGKEIINSSQPIYDQESSMLNAEQADWGDNTDDDELEDQELEAHYMYMAQIQEVSSDAADSGPIFDDEPLQKVSNDDHYNVFAIESAHPKQSKSVHDTYPIEQDVQIVIIDSLDMNYDREEIDQNDDDNDLAKEREIEDFKNKNKSLESSNNYFKEANNRLSESNNLLYADYKKSKAKLVRRNSMEYASQMELKCAKVRGDFLTYKMESQKSCTKYTETINDLNQMISEMKDKLSAHQETISILSQQKQAQIKLYKIREDKELDKVIELEQKVKVLDNIVYKISQSVQTMNMLNNKCRTSFAKPEFLKKAQRVNPRLYDIGCYNDNLALMLATDSDEDLKAQLQDKGIVISELKKLIEKLKGKSVDTKFEKSSVIQQPNAFKSQRLLVLGKPTTFSNSFVRKDFSKSKSVTQNNVSNDFSKPVTAQTLPPNKQSILKNTNVLAPRMYKLHTDHNQARTSQLPQDSRKTNKRLVEIVLFIIYSGCSKHMMGNLKLLINFVEKFLGTVKFGNDQIAPILGYGDLVQGAITTKKGNDLLIGSRGTDLYSITLQDTNFPNLICLMAKASSSQAWLWHRHLSHLNFDTINLLSKNDIVTLHAYFAVEGILHQTSVAQTPEQNGVVKRRNRTLVEAAQTMLSDPKVPLFFWLKQLPLHALLKTVMNVSSWGILLSREFTECFKRARVIMESIHVNFDELPQMASDHVSSDPAPESTSNELDLLFSLMFDELINGSSKVVSKPSDVCSADAPNQRQHHTTPLNNHTTPAHTCHVPTLTPTVTSHENINKAETYVENNQVADDEFINIFCTSVQDQGETSSRYVDSSNMHTFYQRYPSEHRWTKDHP